MALYLGLAALPVCWYLWRNPSCSRAALLVVLLTFSSLLALRILLGMVSSGYPIYYNGPAVLAFLLLARAIIPRAGRSRRFVFQGEALICFACLTAVVLHANRLSALTPTRDWVPLA